MGISISINKGKKGESSIKHNNRDFTEEEWKADYHSHIARNLTGANIIIRKEAIRDVYDKLFGEAVKEYNAKQKRQDRRIKDYYSKVRLDKTLLTHTELVIQIGNVDDYKNGKISRGQAAKIINDYVHDFMVRNKHFYVFNAVIHLDEASVHAHIDIVPIAEGYTKGMKIRPSINKALENEGFPQKTSGSAQWKEFHSHELQHFERILNKAGFERELVGSNRLKDYKEYKEAQKEVALLKGQISDLKLTRKDLSKQILTLKDIREDLSVARNREQGMLEVKKTELHNIQDEIDIQRSKLQELKNTEQNTLQDITQLKEERDRLSKQNQKNKDLQDSYNRLEKDRNNLSNKNKELIAHNKQLSSQLDEAKEENNKLWDAIWKLSGWLARVVCAFKAMFFDDDFIIDDPTEEQISLMQAVVEVSKEEISQIESNLGVDVEESNSDKKYLDDIKAEMDDKFWIDKDLIEEMDNQMSKGRHY